MMKKTLIGAFALMLLSACSNDEPAENQPTMDNDNAYVTINLLDVGTPGLGRGTDGDFEQGTDDENAVTSAVFYFYNANGTYAQHASRTIETWTDQSTNVDKIGSTTVMLTGLKDKEYPKYVVAILNPFNADAYKDLTIDELKEKIVNDYKNSSSKFVMTNSTYNNGDSKSGYFATVLTASNFKYEKPVSQTIDPDAVNIYVERLACKVTITSSLDLGTAYKIGSYDVYNTSTGATEPQDVYMKVLGWGLNATTKTSYVMKNVPDWSTTYGTFTWSDPANFRSYWAKSTNYGTGDYPENYAATTTGTPIANRTLKYVKWDDLTSLLGGVEYCTENTNTADILKASKKFNSTVTHVLLKAQIVKSDGTAWELVNYNGTLYTKDGFLARAANALKTEAYKVTGSTYTPIAPADLEINYKYDGKVGVKLTTTAEGYTWSSTSGSITSITATALNTKLDALTPAGSEAEYYKDGNMYYCIPIEHLRGGKVSFTNAGETNVEEADYGVVRNHSYLLTITEVKNLGSAVYDTGEPIVPPTTTPTYHIGAKINILAWKLVKQDVKL